jgi:predicted metal-dependent hydrolase
MVKIDEKQAEIVLDGVTVSYTVRQSRRARHVRVAIGVKEGVVVSIASAWQERFVEGFLREKSRWILRHLQRMKERGPKKILPSSKEAYTRHKNEFLLHITERVEFFNALYKFSYNKVSVRNQTSLWGSCTRGGNLQFNFKLRYLPQETIDYVVVHELCHLKEHNHSSRFWDLVAKTVPHHKAIRKTLREYVMDEG